MMVTFTNLGNFGRLGNQLFQISASIGTANLHSAEFKFPRWEYSNFFKNPIDQSLDRNDIKNVYRERNFNYDPIPYMEDMDIVGYFQSEKYFSHCKDEIRFYFDFNDDLYQGPINRSLKNCSVHIRRGDYLNLSEYHPFPGMNYYNRSMDYMRKLGVSKFYIFSDDIDWCVNNFSIFNDVEYIQGNSDIKDMCLMSSCDNNIIANSSFSWWGAWLNKNANKKIIAPSVWFGHAKKGVITDDLYCKDWIII